MDEEVTRTLDIVFMFVDGSFFIIMITLISILIFSLFSKRFGFFSFCGVLALVIESICQPIILFIPELKQSLTPIQFSFSFIGIAIFIMGVLYGIKEEKKLRTLKNQIQKIKNLTHFSSVRKIDFEDDIDNISSISSISTLDSFGKDSIDKIPIKKPKKKKQKLQLNQTGLADQYNIKELKQKKNYLIQSRKRNYLLYYIILPTGILIFILILGAMNLLLDYLFTHQNNRKIDKSSFYSTWSLIKEIFQVSFWCGTDLIIAITLVSLLFKYINKEAIQSLNLPTFKKKKKKGFLRESEKSLFGSPKKHKVKILDEEEYSIERYDEEKEESDEEDKRSSMFDLNSGYKNSQFTSFDSLSSFNTIALFGSKDVFYFLKGIPFFSMILILLSLVGCIFELVGLGFFLLTSYYNTRNDTNNNLFISIITLVGKGLNILTSFAYSIVVLILFKFVYISQKNKKEDFQNLSLDFPNSSIEDLKFEDIQNEEESLPPDFML